jgi:hypothetical protein
MINARYFIIDNNTISSSIGREVAGYGRLSTGNNAGFSYYAPPS